MPNRATPVWTRPAVDALPNAVQYLKRDKPLPAQRLAALISPKTGEFPESGRLVPEFPASGLRELVVGEYRIIY